MIPGFNLYQARPLLEPLYETEPDPQPSSIAAYFRKWKGVGRTGPYARYGFVKINQEQVSKFWWAWIGAFIGIGAVALLHQYIFTPMELEFIIGSFGASSVLLFAIPLSPLSQPRNFVGGHLLSAIVGCTSRLALAESVDIWFAAAIAVAFAIVVMQLTETVHPPAGATALIAVLSHPPLLGAGFLYVVFPILSGSLMLLAVALIVNNIPEKGQYPMYWW